MDEKETEEPTVAFEDFKKGLSFVKDLIQKKEGDFYFGQNTISFHINKKPMDTHIIHVRDLDKVVEEIMEITGIILSGEKDEVISDIDANKQHLLQTFKDRCALLEKELIDQNLYRKYDLQMNYKTALLDKFDWNVIIKRKEPGKTVSEFPTAMIRVRVKKPFTDNPPVLKTETIVFESNIEEIEDLIKELSEIKVSLEEGFSKKERRLRR
ncbi:hypothetical protein BMS3Bbin15_00068 [archaeon BMS3Bbin15]|nr:hypothetical protein BMS3Bbin15_00068 [archaeon BMS3Bbin15]